MPILPDRPRPGARKNHGDEQVSSGKTRPQRPTPSPLGNASGLSFKTHCRNTFSRSPTRCIPGSTTFCPSHSRSLLNVHRALYGRGHGLSMNLRSSPHGLDIPHYGHHGVPHFPALDIDISANRHDGVIHFSVNYRGSKTTTTTSMRIACPQTPRHDQRPRWGLRCRLSRLRSLAFRWCWQPQESCS